MRDYKATFWSNVQFGETENDCWEWKAARMPRGYGVITVDKQRWLAHRLAYTWERGPIPDGLFVLHQCDNPSCVNPAHLEIGTQTDNMQQAAMRNRLHQPSFEERSASAARMRRQKAEHPEWVMRGETHATAKLSDLQVAEIRRRRALGEKQRRLAEEFGVSESLISQLVLGQRRVAIGV